MRKWGIFCFLIGCFFFTSGFVVIGHRGDPINYPEESFQSDDSAFAQGADYAELDLHESKDGVLVISHDSDLLRETGAAVSIPQTNFAQIQQYHTRNGEPIHSLQALFAHYQNTNAKFLIETKIIKGEPHPQMEQKIANLVLAYHMEHRVMFHSFSLKSLKRLQKLLPDIPRILIVGSLKRINFGDFQYVSGFNVSSDLVTQQLVNTLHASKMKVYVWDEMNEDRAKWQWLSNINIDGVVTNFPGLAHEYQVLAAKADTKKITRIGASASDQTLQVYTNPYHPTPKGRTIATNQPFSVKGMTSIGKQTYYRIGQNSFVPAQTVNLAPQSGWAKLFLNRTISVQAKGFGSHVFASYQPQADQRPSAYLINHTRATVDEVKFTDGKLWLHLKAGWINARHTNMVLNLNTVPNWWEQYQQIPQAMRPGLCWYNQTGTQLVLPQILAV